MRRSHGGWILAALLLTAIPAHAQQGTSEIGGRVTDEQGAVLPGVAVVVTNEETGSFREIVSGADGSLFAPQMIPGRYRISAKLAGFQSLETGSFILKVRKKLEVCMRFALGLLEE